MFISTKNMLTRDSIFLGFTLKFTTLKSTEIQGNVARITVDAICLIGFVTLLQKKELEMKVTVLIVS